MSWLRYTGLLMLEFYLEAFHVREQRFWFSAEPKVERFLRACLLPIRELDRIIDGRSARICAIRKCPAIGAREQ